MSVGILGNSPKQILVNPHRKVSLAAGLFYLLTFVSIPTLALYGPIHEPNYILSASNDNAVILGGISEILVALCGIASAVVLYPVLRKQKESLALGLVAARILEASTIFAGVAFLLVVVTLHQKGFGADALPVSQTFVALYDRIFLLGQSFIPAINDLLLGILLYQSRLVPRFISIIGIVGSFPLLAGFLAMMFGLIDRVSALAGVSAILVALFEFSLGIYLVVKGFRDSALLVETNSSKLINAEPTPA